MVGGPRDLKELGEQLDWLRRRLAELSEQKTRFLAHVSHELKTPLTTLREGTELLTEQVIGPLNKEQQEVAGIMQGSSLYLQRLIEDLLNFNQALSRRLEIQREPVEMKALVDAVIATQKLAWKSKDLKIVTALEPVLLMADRDKLSTVVDNLLSNAIKFSPPNGEVSISLQAENNTVSLEFQDAGPGFTAQDAGRVFEAFYQGRVTADGPVKGSGLGLAIAREYALIHRGNLEIVPRAGSWRVYASDSTDNSGNFIMKRSGILLIVMLYACAVNPSSDNPSATEESAAVVLTLYQDTEWLQSASKDKRIQLYRQLDRSVTPCLGLRQSLQLALLLGGIEPSLTDYQRAQQVLQACLAQAQEPLLNTYIRIRLDDLERNQQAHSAT